MLFLRVVNVIQITFSYLISRMTGKVFHWGYPLAVSVEPTNSCNLRCPECPSGAMELTRKRGMMTPETFRLVVDQLLPWLSYLTLYFQGEPYMNPGFFEFVRYARSKKIFVATSTNGHFLTPENAAETITSGLNLLIISLDGTDQQAYSSYRAGGDFGKVIKGIQTIVEAKKRLKSSHPKIIIQFLVLKSNQHQIKEIQKLGKELGVDQVQLKTAQFNDFQHGNPLMTDIPRYSRYTLKNLNSKFKIQNSKFKSSIQKSKFKIFWNFLHLQAPQSLSESEMYQFNNSSALPFDNSSPHYALKNRLPNRCFRMWSSCVITWDGKVVPCCYDKDAGHQLGDLAQESLTKIWKSGRYNSFRQMILDHRNSVGICQNCMEGTGISAIF